MVQFPKGCLDELYLIISLLYPFPGGKGFQDVENTEELDVIRVISAELHLEYV